MVLQPYARLLFQKVSTETTDGGVTRGQHSFKMSTASLRQSFAFHCPSTDRQKPGLSQAFTKVQIT
jgi:hypothetical protein